MNKDDAGFFDIFSEEEPIVESGETMEESHPDMSPSNNPTQTDEDKSTESSEGEQLGEQKEEDKTAETNSGEEDVENKRYEHWQSQHDKVLAELNALKAKNTANEDYNEIAQFLYQNPQALLKLQEQLKESAPEGSPQTPTAPEKPERPANYSRYDAAQDPESASAKYEEALMNYNSDMLDYMNARQLYNEEQQYAQMQAAAERERQVQRQEAFKADLLANGLRNEEFSDFMDKLNGQDSMNPKNLIAYYKILAGTGVTKEQLQAEEFARQQARMKNNPKPAGSEGGDTTATPTDDEAFNNDLLNWKR